MIWLVHFLYFGDMIHKSFPVDLAMQFAAARQIFHRSSGARWFYALFVGLPLIYLVVAYNNGYTLTDNFLPNLPIWLFILATMGYAFIITPLIQYYHARKPLRHNPGAQRQQNYALSAQGFRNYGDGFDVEVNWKNVRAVERSSRFLLFYISKNTAYYIPLHLLSEQEIKIIQEWFNAQKQS